LGSPQNQSEVLDEVDELVELGVLVAVAALELESELESELELVVDAAPSELPLAALPTEDAALSFELKESSDPAPFFLSLSLKSVSYQPVPLSLKLGAESSFFSALASHCGQSRSASSLNFWSLSNW